MPISSEAVNYLAGRSSNLSALKPKSQNYERDLEIEVNGVAMHGTQNFLRRHKKKMMVGLASGIFIFVVLVIFYKQAWWKANES